MHAGELLPPDSAMQQDKIPVPPLHIAGAGDVRFPYGFLPDFQNLLFVAGLHIVPAAVV